MLCKCECSERVSEAGTQLIAELPSSACRSSLKQCFPVFLCCYWENSFLALKDPHLKYKSTFSACFLHTQSHLAVLLYG